MAGLASGADDFVTKPIRIDLLLEKIGAQLGIEWETAPIEMERTQNGRVISNDDEPLVVPGGEDIEQLYKLAMMGNMQNIAAWATELEAGNHNYRRFAEKLRDLVGGFKTKAILALAKQYRGDRK